MRSSQKSTLSPAVALLTLVFSAGALTAQGAIEQVVQAGTPTFTVNAGDVDGDGRLDLLHEGNQSALWSRNLGEGAFAPPAFIASSIGVAAIEVVDIDGNGTADIVWQGIHTIRANLRDIAGTLASPTILAGNLPRNGRDMEVVDLDNDGRLDVLGSFSDSGGVGSSAGIWAQNLSSAPLTFGPPQTLEPGVGTFTVDAMHAADLDGDGDAEVMTATHAGWSWRNNLSIEGTPGAFSAPQFLSTAGSGSEITTADLDGDGDLDIITDANHTGAQTALVWYRNEQIPTGTLTFAAAQTIATLDLVSRIEVADMDDDGDLDLLTMVNNGVQVISYENTGAGSFSTGQVIFSRSPGSAVRSLKIADVDGNGRMDLMVGVSGPESGAYLVRRFPPTSLTYVQVPSGDLHINLVSDKPNHFYVNAITQDPANANGGLGSGWWGGLHIPISELIAILSLPAAPFQGNLNGNATMSFIIPAAGLSGLSGLTFYSNATLFDDTTGQQSGVSPAVAFTIQ